MDAGIAGVRHVDETMYISSTAETLSLAIENITKTLEKKYDIKPREKRKYPEMFKYVGWCSWDAFYKDISEKKVLDKAKEIAEKKLPIRWMIFDDGWLQDENGIYRFKLREKGKIGFVCRSTVEKVSLNGEDITNRLIDRGSYYLVDINGSPEECMLEVAIKRRMEK